MKFWFFIFTFLAAPLIASELVVYSERNEQLIQPIFEMFTEETGIKVKYRTDKAGVLIQRLKAEGARTPADILLTVDAGNLWQAKKLGVLQAFHSPLLAKKIPAHLRDPEGFWYGFSIRARTLVYNTNKVKAKELSNYADLADPKWKGEVLLRTSKKVYNQSLVAMLIAEAGEPAAETIVKGWVANLGAPVFSNDTRLMETLAAGTGSVGIVNSYYYGRLLRKKADLPLALFWPARGGGSHQTGVHINISGAGLTAFAKHRKEAERFLNWLASDKAQMALAGKNLEFPAVESVEKDAIVASWGTFQANTMNLSKAGELQKAAILLMDRAGYK